MDGPTTCVRKYSADNVRYRLLVRLCVNHDRDQIREELEYFRAPRPKGDSMIPPVGILCGPYLHVTRPGKAAPYDEPNLARAVKEGQDELARLLALHKLPDKPTAATPEQ